MPRGSTKPLPCPYAYATPLAYALKPRLLCDVAPCGASARPAALGRVGPPCPLRAAWGPSQGGPVGKHHLPGGCWPLPPPGVSTTQKRGYLVPPLPIPHSHQNPVTFEMMKIGNLGDDDLVLNTPGR